LFDEADGAFHPGYNAGTITPLPTVTSVSAVSQYPQEVKDILRLKSSIRPEAVATQDVLAEQIEIYLKDRTSALMLRTQTL